MSFDTAAGATISISAAAPATYDAAGFAALTYTNLGEVVNIGEFGRQYNLVQHNALADRGTKKARGSYNNGSLNPQYAYDSGDAGQQLLRTQLLSDDPISVLVETDQGEKFYFEVVIMSAPIQIGSVDEIITSSCSFEVTHNDIVEVMPA